VGVEAANVGAYRPNRNTLNVSSYSFLKSTRVIYAIDQKRITVEDRRFRFDQFLTGMHTRGGFAHEGILQNSWGVVVDIVCFAVLLWVATGLYLWWGLAEQRHWGWVAIVAGAGLFLLFTFRL
jgi:hypothetical protein